MDLLESILRSANAESYTDLFRKCNIDPSVLPLLTDADLQIIGVTDNKIRSEILKKSTSLVIPHEKKVDTNVNKEYVEFVLTQMSRQLHLHYACLQCAIIRKDVILCDIKLNNAARCLINCINSLERQIEVFERTVNKKQKRSKKNKQVASLIALGGTLIITFVLTGKLIRDYILT